MTRFATSMACLLLLVLATDARAQATGQVRAKLLTDYAAATSRGAAEPFYVGVQLTIMPGWHVYWSNPGESGLATEVEWNLPEGYEAGPLLFPVPTRFLQPGAVVGYGYERSVILLSKVTPPQGAQSAGPITLGADVSWLVCKEVCVPGGTQLSEMSDRVDPASADLIAQTLQQVPRPVGEMAKVRTSGSLEEGQITVTVEWNWPVRNATFFPSANKAMELRQIKVSQDGQATTIAFVPHVYAGQQVKEKTLDAVVAYDDERGGRRGIEISIPLTAP